MDMHYQHGAVLLEDGAAQFSVWAPEASRVDLHILNPRERRVQLKPCAGGYFRGTVREAGAGSRYFFRLDDQDGLLPDPASRFQPEGVHGPSEIPPANFEWQDRDWTGIPLESHIFYELHVGTFTPRGTFEAIVPYLSYLREVGITAIELMPVAQFPGSRNWGYDGVYPFAAQNSYGGPWGLKNLVNECHRHGLAVVLDVVYNHLGPEGNYLSRFGPYFTSRYRTPWGAALNFDGPESDEVRRFFVENALYWVTEVHVDALRLDAIHAIFDQSAYPFLEELGDAVHDAAARTGRNIHVFPESSLNDTRIVRSKTEGGFAHDAQWNDDFHHSLRTLITDERAGYYADFGELRQLAKAFREGFVYSGEYSGYRRRRHGNSSAGIPARRFIVCDQNHDQVGNRMLGERLGVLVEFETLKLAAGAVLLSPFLPLLFMGEEYGETAPFLYFVSHTDAGLIEAVRRGRKEEFARFEWKGEVPDPQAEDSFRRSRLHHELRRHEKHAALLGYYKCLVELRKTRPSLKALSKRDMEVAAFDQEQVLTVRRWTAGDEILCAFAFGHRVESPSLGLPAGRWRRILDSSDNTWHGPGTMLPESLESSGSATVRLNPRSAAVLAKEP